MRAAAFTTIVTGLPASPASELRGEPVLSRRRIAAEVLIVLGLSLGQSAAYSIVSIIDRLTQTVSLGDQSTTINGSLSDRSWLDLTYQLMGIFFGLMPVALVCYLLWQAVRPRLGRLGIDFTKPGRDILVGIGLALAIGIPGIGVYLAGRALGLTVNVVADGLNAYWWTIPVLVLSAARAGLSEEVIVIGYLFARLRELGLRKWWIILAAAALRGSYHLYQGFGAFVGNFAMGVIFGWLYWRFGRVIPLVIAHFVIDAAIFIGYPWAYASFPALFGG